LNDFRPDLIMVKFILAIILLTGTLSVKAQPIDTPYFRQPGLHKFEGTWIYTNHDITFKIILEVQKILTKTSNPIYMDIIVGHHMFMKGDSIIQNSIGKDKTITVGGFIDMSNTSKIGFHFVDLHNLLDGTLELLPNDEIKWKVRNREGARMKIPGQKDEDYTIYVPRELILKKVE
jgi:hypothetical protein